MARQSGPLQEVSRLLDLVPYLSTHSHISLKELAGEFGVSEKEMGQELTSLSMCGLPGYTPYELIEVFFDSGFVTINNHETLDIPRALTNLEIASLLIGLAMIEEESEGDAKISGAISNLTQRLQSLLRSSVTIDEESFAQVPPEIRSALNQRKVLSFSYLSPMGKGSETRDVEPTNLYLENSHIYLRAFCRQANAFRTFRIDRMSRFAIGENFTFRTPGGDEIQPRSHLAEISIHSHRREVAEALSLESIPSNGRISYSSYSREWVERAVIALAPRVSLEAPKASRAAIRDQVEKILALYRG